MAERTGLVVKGGRLVDASGVRSGDVRIVDGVIDAVGPDLSGADVLDATGCVVAPGFVDLNTHVQVVDGGGGAYEDLWSLTAAALLGGFTAVQVQPDAETVLDRAATLDQAARQAMVGDCDVRLIGALTAGIGGDRLAEIGTMARLGVSWFCDGGTPVDDPALLRRAMEYVAGFDGTVGLRSEDVRVTGSGRMHEGEWSTRLGIPGQPAEAEEIGMMRDLALARLAGCRIHFHAVSSAGGVAILRAAKAGGLPVTADVTPHQLAFTDADCASYDPAFQVWPPLRSDDDRAALRAAVLDGTIDAIATDHRAVLDEDKDDAFDTAHPGAVGLELALAAALTHLDASVEEILAPLSWRPAAVATRGADAVDLVDGAPASMVVVDPDAEWTVDPHRLASRHAHTPFAGATLRGKVRHTIVRGVPRVVDGSLTRSGAIPR